MKQSRELGKFICLKEYLRDIYFSLLEEKAAESISVSEIAKLAGVSRMSFYRYYQNKEDISRQYVHETLGHCMETVRGDQIKDLQASTTLLFNYLRSNKRWITILNEQKLFHLFFKSFSHFLQESILAISGNLNTPQEIERYYYQYTCGGVLNLIKNWVGGGMKESGEEMALIVRQLTSTAVVGSL